MMLAIWIFSSSTNSWIKLYHKLQYKENIVYIVSQCLRGIGFKSPHIYKIQDAHVPYI